MIIGLGGYAGAGKDTAADYMSALYGFEVVHFTDDIVQILSRIDPIVDGELRFAEATMLYGYDSCKAKFPEYRELLQRAGTEWGREYENESYWIHRLFNRLSPQGNYVIPQIRFRNEALAVKGWCDGGHVWKVVRPGVGPVNDHISDNCLEKIPWDGTIMNDDGITELFRGVDTLMDLLGVDKR